MQALVFHEVKQPLRLEEREDLSPGPGEVVVALKTAALNRRDYWITQGLYPGVRTPVVLGSDGAGVVGRIGAGVDIVRGGDEVIINPGLDWGDSEAAQSGEFRILGMPDDGVFASQVVAPADALHPKPAHLDWSEAAALPLAGVTVYRALFRQAGLRSGQTVLISGVGGGVAALGLKFAAAAGATVLVTSSSDEKITAALSQGATAGFNYSNPDWKKEVKSRGASIEVILDSAGGAGYGDLLDLAAPGGCVVNYGSTAGAPPKLDLFKVFWKQLRIIGTTMGSPADFQAMLNFVNDRKIKPTIDRVFPLAEGNAALECMRTSKQFGKIVLEIDRT